MLSLKQLMDDGIDVGALYTKTADMVNLIQEVQKKEEKILDIQGEVREIIEDVPSIEGVKKIDMMNGSVLCVSDDDIWMEVPND